MWALLALTLLAALARTEAQGTYAASARRLLTEPLVSMNNSPFTYNYNPGLYFDRLSSTYFMVVRCQNQTSASPYDVGPSFLALTHFLDNTFTSVAPLSFNSIVLSPRAPSEDGCGDEDPRTSVSSNGTLFVTFTAYTCSQPNLALATVPVSEAAHPAAYTRRGTLVPNSKSAGLLLRDPPALSYMYYGGGVISVATSIDGGLHWGNGATFFTPRAAFFDSDLVEGGPAPLPLSDGNLFYLFNSDTNYGPPSRKPSWTTSYHCEWAVLDGRDPTSVLQRSDAPLLSPELPWEQDQPGLLTPNVVFCEGMVPHPTLKDTFVFVYGAGDSFVGVGQITVAIPPPPTPITAARRSITPLLSRANSAATYTYDPGAYIAQDGSVQLLPRVRNTTASNPTTSDPYSVGPSAIGWARVTRPFWNTSTTVTGEAVLDPADGGDLEKCGVEDVRIVWHAALGAYVATYTAFDCSTPRIMLATARDPAVRSSWKRLGPIFATGGGPVPGSSKSGALLLRDRAPHYLFWGDGSDGAGLHLAVSLDDAGMVWEQTAATLLHPRPDGAQGATAFDARLVEAGPPPLVLPSGDLLLLYNGARSGVPSPRPGWDAEYCVGYAVLNGSNPLHVIQRSPAHQPLLCPELPWEIGTDSRLPTTQYPNRLASNGAVPLPGGSPGQFLLVYGAADSYAGTAVVTVTETEGHTDASEPYAVRLQ